MFPVTLSFRILLFPSFYAMGLFLYSLTRYPSYQQAILVALFGYFPVRDPADVLLSSILTALMPLDASYLEII